MPNGKPGKCRVCFTYIRVDDEACRHGCVDELRAPTKRRKMFNAKIRTRAAKERGIGSYLTPAEVNEGAARARRKYGKK